MLRFNDGEAFDLDGDLRVERRKDGLYVVGNGMLIPVADREEAARVMADFAPKPAAAPAPQKGG